MVAVGRERKGQDMTLTAFDAARDEINGALVAARARVRSLPADDLAGFLDDVRARASAAALGEGTASFADLALVALAQMEIASREGV